MKVLNAFLGENSALLDRYIDRGQLAHLRIVVETAKEVLQPDRHGRAARRGEPLNLCKTGNRQDTRHNRDLDPSRDRLIAERKKSFRLEEELGDRAGGSRIYLALQIIQIGLRAGRFWMDLGIGRDRYLEIGDAFQPADQIDGIGISIRMRRVFAGPRLRIAAQCDDMADAPLPI